MATSLLLFSAWSRAVLLLADESRSARVAYGKTTSSELAAKCAALRWVEFGKPEVVSGKIISSRLDCWSLDRMADSEVDTGQTLRQTVERSK